jgi:hypothetical protein
MYRQTGRNTRNETGGNTDKQPKTAPHAGLMLTQERMQRERKVFVAGEHEMGAGECSRFGFIIAGQHAQSTFATFNDRPRHGLDVKRLRKDDIKTHADEFLGVTGGRGACGNMRTLQQPPHAHTGGMTNQSWR